MHKNKVLLLAGFISCWKPPYGWSVTQMSIWNDLENTHSRVYINYGGQEKIAWLSINERTEIKKHETHLGLTNSIRW